ncbi:hypothetical protein N7481_001385 [Penicillium waksmanii]|uniref:uncharacterized protein n=1 Tax=Penicillium waksmanii TaxID=69791 RepID=UPI00254808E9|nr:uncharacterized protein N7481_001385 [Penicillium waksmanii]KAJ6000976.1 hypothetical protein N7481_001385 [Penicillium waksmanii]
MPPGAEIAERAATPEPIGMLIVPPAPPNPARTSGRSTKAPTTYAQEQNKEAVGKLEKRHRRNSPETSLRGSSTTGDVATYPREQPTQAGDSRHGH